MAALTTLSSALSLLFKIFGSGDCWYGLGVGWVMGQEDVSFEMGGVTKWKVFPIFGLAGADV